MNGVPMGWTFPDNHFNGREIQEKLVTIDIRNPDADREIRKVI